MALKMTFVNLEEKFTPLPKEQRLTEESLIALERKIAESSRKNDEMLEKSLVEAEKSPGMID